MANTGKTKEQLSKELAEARRHISQLETLEDERTWAQQELRKTLRAFKVLSGCNQVIIRATEESKLLDEVCRIIVDVGGYRLAWVGFAEPDKKKTVRPVAQRGYEQGYLETDDITWADNERGRGPTGTAIRTAKPVVVRDILTEPSYAPWRREAIRRNFASSIALPLGSGQPAFGALNIYATESDAFDAEEVKLLTELADDLTYSITALHTETQRKQAEKALAVREKQLSLLFDNVGDVIFVLSVEPDDCYRFIMVNHRFQEATGLSENQVMGKRIEEIIPEPAHALVLGKYKEAIQTGQPVRWEEVSIYPTGKKVGEVAVAPMFDANGNCTQLIGTVHDITEQRQVQDMLRASEERYHMALDSLLEGCQIIDFNYRYIYLNNVAAEHGRRKREELLGHTMMEIYPGIEDTEMFANLSYCLEKRIPHRMENLFTFPDDSKGWFELSIEPIPEGIFILSQDITERKRAEETLRQSEEKLRAIFDSLALGVVVSDRNGKILQVNEAKVRMHGYDSKEELIGRSFLETIAEKDHARAMDNRRRRLEHGYFGDAEYTFLRKDGSEFPGEVSNAVLSDASGNEIGLISIIDDITERKRAEAKLEQSAREWQITFDSISDWVSVHSKDFKILRVNKAFADFLKMKPEAIIGQHCYELIHGENEASQYCSHKEALETGKPAYREFYNPHLGIYMEVVCAPIFDERGEISTTVHIGRDITERKRIEAQMMVTDRMASVGELASGIAHELNNPLTGVIGFSELLLEKDVPDDVKEDLMVINREAQRAARVVRNLLTFARKHPQEKQAVDINNALKLVLELRAYEQKLSNIAVNTHLAADLPEVMADSFQLQQVFLNVIINAEYFMIETHKRGALTITTERVRDIIRISLADDGPGVAQENLEHIFDPFFTTKEVGKGTGLGLSICHGIITKHNGRIYAESEPGKGATFIIELPISQ